MRKSKLAIAIGAAAVSLMFGTGIALASGWHVVSKRSASGGYAVTATDATINHPHRIAVRFSRGSGLVVWSCDKGFSVGSWSRNYGAGFHELRHVYGKNSCDVTASVGGSGRVGVQILTSR